MSVYLALKNPNPNNTPASFIAKGLPGYSPAQISTLAIMGRERYPEVAYGLYRNYIDSFMFSCFSNKKVFAQAEAYSNLYLAGINLPFSSPPMVFTPGVALSEDEATQLLKKLGEGATLKNVGKTKEFTITSPKSADVDKFLAISNPIYATGFDRLSPLGSKTYFKCLTLIDLFLQANYYPAYKSLNEEIPKAPDMDWRVAGTSNTDTEEYFFAYRKGLRVTNERYIDSHATLSRKRGFDEDQIMDDSTEKGSVVGDGEKVQGVMSFETAKIHSSVTYAKPSGRPSSQNFGPPGQCPALPGLVFPYFKGLNRPDYVTIKTTFTNLFFRLFGTTFKECKEELVHLKRGANSLSNTEAGMEITHVLKGIELALRTQTRLFLLFENGYLGFCLLGAHFEVYDGSKWVGPVEYEKLKEELSKLDTHSSAISELCTLISAVKMKEGGVAEILEGDIKEAMDLISAMRIRDFGDNETNEHIDKALRRLIWPQPFLQISPDTLLSFLTSLSDKDWVPKKEQAFYIPNCLAPLEEKLFLLLSLFGPDAPSLWNTRGQKISVLPGKSRKGKEKDSEDVPPPSEIIILPKPLLVALKEWKMILKDAVVSFNPKERAKDHRGHVVRSEDMRKKIWSALQQGLKDFEVDDEEGPSKKKRKTVEGGVNTAAELLGLF